MDPLTCPVCAAEMDTRPLGDGEVNSCPSGHGVFLRRADLGSLVEAESDWHRHAGQHTQPMPRITADMTAPPVGKPAARAWVETLFDRAVGREERAGDVGAIGSSERSD